MLIIGKPNTIKFRVNVMGTNTEPNVQLVLNTSPKSVFNAIRDSSETDIWICKLDIPNIILSGEYLLNVEVIINNHLFVPVKKTIKLVSIIEKLDISVEKDIKVENIKTKEKILTPISSPKKIFGRVDSGFNTIPKKFDSVDTSILAINKLISPTVENIKPLPIKKHLSAQPKKTLVQISKGAIIYE
jgi:hypothetical protein